MLFDGRLNHRLNLLSLRNSNAVFTPRIWDIQAKGFNKYEPLTLRTHANGEPPIAGFEDAIGHEVWVGTSHTLRHHSGQGVVSLIDEGRNGSVPQGNIDTRTLPSPLSNQQGGKNSTDSVHPRHHVNPRNAYLCRRAFRFARDGHNSAASLHGEVKGRLVSTRAVLTVARDATKDCLARCFSEIPFKGSRFEILYDDICLIHQCLNSCSFFLDIRRDDDLASIR